ncbi:MAG: carboxypeptidase regulatory-like domain-containing protein [Acidobacteriia bacterium]|nr:carboxypeptidase regulatory-like domain-containing protein [Terriglobia bacterium]
MKRRILAPGVVCLLLAAFGLLTPTLFGQASDSIIVGTVTDSSGSAVPSAAITATNKDTGVKYSTLTNSTGEYRLNNIPVGHYDISASAKGFTPATMANVELQLNHTVPVNLILAVGTVNTTVDVTEAAAMIDTSTAQVQTTYDSKAATDMAMAGISKVVNGAGIYNLSLLGAGVTSSGGVGQGTGPSIAGQRPENNAFNIDGVMNDAHYTTGPQIYVSNEAVAQFNLVQNQFSAEFGAASGGVFNAIVRSGTNQIHGSAYEYMQNRNLNAVDATEVQQGLRSNPRFDNNRFGGTIGGPIKKDKLFYFGNFEYNPIGQASQPGQTVFAPTSAGIAVLNGMGNLSKTNLGVFTKFVPVAPTADPTNPITVNGVNIPDGPLSFASPNFNNNTNVVGAVDWNVSSSDQVRGRYFYNRTRGLDFLAALPVFFQPQPVTNNGVSVSEFHNFSPSLENELRVSYIRDNASTGAGNFQFPGLDVFPNISIDDIQLQLGPDPNTPTGQIENLSQLQENITKTWGRHTLKAGYNVADVILSGFFVQRARGDYDYASLEEFLLDNQPSGGSLSGVQGERSVGTANGVPFGFVQHAAYANDDYRIRPNLTLNLGLRYEYVTVPVGSRAQQFNSIANVPGVITFAAPKSDTNNWAPRIGFAYSPGKSGTWSIRGGVSRSYDNTYINLNQNASPPFYQTTVDVNGNNPVSNFLANGGLKAALATGTPSVADARAATASYTFDQHRPYALTGTIGVQRLLGKDYTIEARYVYTKGVHLWNQTRLNIISPVTPTTFIPTYFTTPTAAQLAANTLTLGALKGIVRPGTTADLPFNDLAAFGFNQALTGYHPWGNSRYNGLAFQMNKRYSKNFSYTLAYTWSHNFDDSTATNFSTILSPRRAQDFQNMRAEWASSALDRRQRFTFAPIYDFRPFAHGSWLMKNLVGNWNISGVYTFQSPEYATVQSGVDSNLNNDSAGDRAIVNPAGAANVGSGVTGLNAAGQAMAANDPSIVAYVANNPNARYVVAGAGALANGGRNTFAMAHTNNFDASLMKRIGFGEARSFQVGVQAFNLFNHAQFVGGYLSDVSAFSTAAISRNFLVPSSPFFSQTDQFFASNSRQMQLVARFVF